MDYSILTTYLSDLTAIQIFGMLFVCIICTTAVWTMLTYITSSLIDPAKNSNKKLLDNMNRLDTKSNINSKLTKK